MKDNAIKIEQKTLNDMAKSVCGLLKTVYSTVIHDEVFNIVSRGSMPEHAEKIAKYAMKGWERALSFAYEKHSNSPNVVNLFALRAVFYHREKEFMTFLTAETEDVIKRHLTAEEDVLLHFANAFFARYPIYLEKETVRKKLKV